MNKYIDTTVILGVLYQARLKLDYDLRGIPDKVCDENIWNSNMNTYKYLSEIIRNIESGEEINESNRARDK
jgi:hypothetical protein